MLLSITNLTMFSYVCVCVCVCRYPHVRMYSRLVDAHLYLLKKWVLDYLMDNKCEPQEHTLTITINIFERNSTTLANSFPFLYTTRLLSVFRRQ